MLRIKKEALTFDDVLLIPSYSDILPSDVNLSTKLTKNIRLAIPIVSAAMDTVTESKMAIELAYNGGIGFIHKNMSINQQAKEVIRVKNCKNSSIINPVTVCPEHTIKELLEIINRNGYTEYPVVKNKKLIGIINKNDVKFVKNINKNISFFMKSKKFLTTVCFGETYEVILQKVCKKHVKKILIVNDKHHLIGMINVKDIQNTQDPLGLCKDKNGRLQVGAAVGTDSNSEKRVDALVESGIDILLIDSSHGHSYKVLTSIRKIRKKYPYLPIIGGNVVTGDGAKALINEGANIIKVGVGPGSICTTRIITGVGMPQITAISDVAEAIKGMNIPVISDGGIRFSGDIAKAIAAGASSVMIGYMLAGSEESPGKKIFLKGKLYKEYRGMGSLKSVSKWSSDRYFQFKNGKNKFIPEGVEGKVFYKGFLRNIIYYQMGGLRSCMGLTGCKTIEELRTKAEFVRVSNLGVKENHAHDIVMIKEAPNYSI